MMTDARHDAAPLADTTPNFAPVWRRMLAGCYDFLIVLALWFAIGAAALALTRGELDARHPLFRLTLAAITLAYFALSWQRGGQTIGARAWRLRVEDRDGRVLNARDAWLRAVVLCVGAVPLGLGTAIAWFDDARRAVQDRAVGSRVVQQPHARL